jgi:MerR family copper efflux transcriptional regulator
MNLSNYLRTSQAAEFLGVSPGTVRNWEKQGKLRAHKLPQNGYRLFLKADLEVVLRTVQDSRTSPRTAGHSTVGEKA